MFYIEAVKVPISGEKGKLTFPRMLKIVISVQYKMNSIVTLPQVS